MKITVTLVLVLFFSQMDYCQQVDSTIVFETEEVVEFKKQTIVDEFLVPYEADEGVTLMFRIGFTSASSENLIRNPLGHNAYVDYQIKINAANNLGIGLSMPSNAVLNSIINPYVYFKHFINMKERVENKVQRKNFTGKYWSIAYGYSPKALDLNNNEFILKGHNRTRYYNGSAARLSYGVQLGNILDFSVTGGVHSSNKLTVGTDGTLERNMSRQSVAMPFVSTNSHFTISIGNGKSPKNCEFMNCYRTQDKVLKIGFNRLFYAYLENLSMNGNISFERRIANSFFTTNSDLSMNIDWTNQFDFTGDSLDLGRSVDYQSKVPIFNDKVRSNFMGDIRFMQELRYYAGQKKRIAKGESAQNLNGGYFTAFAGYRQSL